MARRRSRGNGRGFMKPAPALPEEDDDASADERADLVIFVCLDLRLLVLGDFDEVAAASGVSRSCSWAWAWERTFRRLRWWARLFRAEREDEENFEKKIVSRRGGMWAARKAEVRIRVGR